MAFTGRASLTFWSNASHGAASIAPPFNGDCLHSASDLKSTTRTRVSMSRRYISLAESSSSSDTNLALKERQSTRWRIDARGGFQTSFRMEQETVLAIL